MQISHQLVSGWNAFPETGQPQLFLNLGVHVLGQRDQSADLAFFGPTQGGGRDVPRCATIAHRSFAKNFLSEHSKEWHLLLLVQAIGGLLACTHDPLAQLLQFLVNLGPVVGELLKYLRQRIREGGLQLRVIVQFNIQVVANSMFNRGSFGSETVVLFDLLLKVLVQD